MLRFLLVVLLLLAIRSHCHASRLQRRVANQMAGDQGNYSLDINVCNYVGTVGQIRQMARMVIDASPPFINRSAFRINVVVHHTSVVKDWPPSWNIMHSENTGREAGCILHWITNRYNDLADFTAFIHDRVDSYSRHRIGRRMTNVFTPKTGMLALAIIDYVPCDGRPQNGPNNLVHPLTNLRELYGITQGKFCTEGWKAPFNGQFIVSRKRILGQPLSLYRYLMDSLMTSRLFNFRDPITGKIDHDPGGIFFGWLMERAWALLFRCTDIKDDVCEDKPANPIRQVNNETDASEWLGCLPGACQCLD